MILYLAADLIWGTRIKATAESLGISARPVRSLEMLEARLGEVHPTPIRGLLLDLEKPDEALAMLARLRDRRPIDPPPFPAICWAPHVERGLMEQAAAAGAARVLTRGAFDANLPRLLAELEGVPPCE